jgi:hypothetical protein
VVLDRFRHVNAYKVSQPVVEKEAAPHSKTLMLPNDTINITLADQSPFTENYVTVHRLADYRRKSSSILLVPHVEAIIDCFLFSREEVMQCAPTL